MTDYAKLRQELTGRQVDDFKRNLAFQQEDCIIEALIKRIKAELPQAVVRQHQAGWPNVTPEQVWVPGWFGPKRRHVGLVSVSGDESLTLPLRFNSTGYGAWLGTDGHLYKTNHAMWTSPKLNPPPFERIEFRWYGDISELESILASLRAL